MQYKICFGCTRGPERNNYVGAPVSHLSCFTPSFSSLALASLLDHRCKIATNESHPFPSLQRPRLSFLLFFLRPSYFRQRQSTLSRTASVRPQYNLLSFLLTFLLTFFCTSDATTTHIPLLNNTTPSLPPSSQSYRVFLFPLFPSHVRFASSSSRRLGSRARGSVVRSVPFFPSLFSRRSPSPCSTKYLLSLFYFLGAVPM